MIKASAEASYLTKNDDSRGGYDDYRLRASRTSYNIEVINLIDDGLGLRLGLRLGFLKAIQRERGAS